MGSPKQRLRLRKWHEVQKRSRGMRIAYVDYTQNVYTFGGVSSYILSLLDTCDHLGAFLDIYTGSTLEARGSRIPPEIAAAYKGHICCGYGSAKGASSRYALFPAYDGAVAVDTLLRDSKYKVHDLVIFGNPTLALLASFSGFRHPRMFVYLHQHELFLDMVIPSDVLPKWSIPLQRDILRWLPIAGCLTQCEENIVRIRDKIGIDNIFVAPITMPGFTRNYEGKRSGWAYLGSGEKQKNPDLVVAIFNLVGNQHVHFYVSRSVGRLKRLLTGVRFPYTVHEKLSRSDLIDEMQKRIGGIHCAQAEGFGLSVAEQMHFYPVLLWDGGEYVEHFPSSILFSDIDGGAQLVGGIPWSEACQRNSVYLDSLSVEVVAAKYTKIMDIPVSETSSQKRVGELLVQSTSYADVLAALGWQDHILAAGSALKWGFGRQEDSHQTYLVPDGSKFISETRGSLF